MKLHQFIIISLFCTVFYNCYEEDNIVAEKRSNKREHMYDTNSSDKIIKFVSQYYYNYDRFFITDADSSDYLYNFMEKNDAMKVTPPVQDAEHLWKGIEMVKTLLLDSYSKQFIHDHFPYSIILTDHIYHPTFEEDVDYLAGRYFCMINVQDINTMSVEEKIYATAKLHETIWLYIGLYDEFIKLPAEFYKYGEGLYGEFAINIPLETEEDFYKVGFPLLPLYWGAAYRFPTKEEDIGYWISFLVRTPEEKIQEIVKKYDAIRIRYNHLTIALEKAGIDYKKLKYSEK